MDLSFFQIFGLNRSPSMEFKELTKRDAQASLAHELEKLRQTGNLADSQAQTIDKEFDGFQKLFAKFLTSEAQDSVQWDKIEKLGKNAVSQSKMQKVPFHYFLATCDSNAKIAEMTKNVILCDMQTLPFTEICIIDQYFTNS